MSKLSVKQLQVCFAFWIAAICLVSGAAAKDRPNVLVIMVDDLGFSDIGCYGGEIETPNLDKLAAGGLRFKQFYNTAKCHSSRISLLTGCYAFQAGNTSLKRAVTSAEVLRKAGYTTMMTGKWHLDQQPTDFGFDRYFGHLSGACNYFLGDKTFRLDGQPWTVPEKDFYTTIADVDYAIDFLGDARKTKKPWYLYVAFNAPHAPLQALEEDYRKYEGRYDEGWDIVRDRRFEKQKAIGLFPQDTKPSARPDHVPAWNTLSEKRRSWESRRMTTLAAMIDRVDQEIGRLVKDIKQSGELENTMILFVSDNGACPYDRRSTGLDARPTSGSVTWGDTTGWAWCRNGPFRYYKQNQFEGGISSPGIVHWPAGLKSSPGSFADTPAHLVDVLPTLSEICEAPIPDTWPKRDVQPVSGISLAPIFAGKSLAKRPPIHLLFSADRGLRDGDWKAVSFRSGPWELYNMADDRTELHNLASKHPERLASMTKQWTEMCKDVLGAPERAYAPVATEAKPHQHPEWTDFSKEPSQNGKRDSKNRSGAKSKAKTNAIRARKETKMRFAGKEIQLTTTGIDGGLAMDRLENNLPVGPYRLTFQIKSTADGAGEIYYTVDGKTKLPSGIHQTFDVTHDGEWHDVSLDLKTDKSIRALRLDVNSSPGSTTISNLKLLSVSGETIVQWPSN